MAARIPKVVVMGPSYVDMSVQCESTPAPGKCVKGLGFSNQPSGHGPNQAIEAAKCDCAVSIIGSVGKDCLGDKIRENLVLFGVNVDHLFTAEAKNTGIIVTLVDENGENISCYSPGANSTLSSDHIASVKVEQAISDADCCLISGDLNEDAIISAIRLAELHKTRTVLSLNFSLDDAHKHLHNFPLDYYNVDLMVLEPEKETFNENAANIVHDLKLLATDLVARGVKNVIMRCGRRGCILLNYDGSSIKEPFDHDSRPISCGKDAFLGAAAACFAVQDTLENAVNFAMAAETLACQRPPSQENLPQKTHIIELLQNQMD